MPYTERKIQNLKNMSALIARQFFVWDFRSVFYRF